MLLERRWLMRALHLVQAPRSPVGKCAMEQVEESLMSPSGFMMQMSFGRKPVQ